MTPADSSARLHSLARIRFGWRGPLWALMIALFTACASDDDLDAMPNELLEPEPIPSAEVFYQQAIDELEGYKFLFFDQIDFQTAIELFQQVIDNYPYSEYATLAELKIADIEFRRQNYQEAAAYYQDFVELHPSHERASYALYRQALCKFEQMRQADQDQTPTQDTIELAQVYLDRYPDGADVAEVRELLVKGRDQLAKRDVMVGDFYFDRNECYAAYRRYQKALRDYPEHASRHWTQTKLAQSLICMRRFDEAQELLRSILSSAPEDEDLLELVEDELEGLSSS